MKAQAKVSDWTRGKWRKPASNRGVFLRGEVWYIRYVKNGKLKTEKSGLDFADAVALVKRRRGQVDDERNHPEKYRAAVLFDEIADDVIAITRGRYEKKYPEREFKPGRLAIVKKWFIGIEARRITTAMIRGKLNEVGTTPATFNRYLVVVGHIFRVAVENEKAERSPVKPIKQIKENNFENFRYLNQNAPDEEDRLRAAIRKSRYPLREVEVDLALATGMRLQEQYQLLWADVDLLKGQKITIQQSKAGRRQFIPISPSACAALAKLRAMYPKPNERVCPLGYSSAHRRWWVSVRKAAKLGGLRWHDLRHSFASRLAEKGVDIYTLSKLMRHANVSMTQRYAHLSDEHLQREIAKLDAPAQLIQPTDTRVEHVQ
jgi:integrase